MTDKELITHLKRKNKILFNALQKSCEYMCKYPPAELPEGEYEDIVWKAMMGSGVDPRGPMRYMMYFIEKTVEENKNIEKEE